MNKRRKIGSGFIKKIRQITDEIFSDDSIEIHSASCAFVTGCIKLKAYSPSEIVLALNRSDLVISGEGLEPESLINGQIAVRGDIKEVRYVDN